MDAVILAAGKGTRLDGIAAPYHKPLVPITGKPLVSHAVDQAKHAGAERIVVVVAPENALPISQVLGDRAVTLVVQRNPTGPGDALLRGLDAVKSDRVLVLMGDNYFERDDVSNCVIDKGERDAIGVRVVPEKEAARFTRISASGYFETEEGLDVTYSIDNECLVWVGPIVLSASNAAEFLTNVAFDTREELKIGKYLGAILRSPELVTVETLDIGVPEAFNA